MAATDLITAVVAVLAFGLSVASFVFSRRATKAAEASADAARRSASVAEQAEQRAAQEAEERAVRWQLVSAGGGWDGDRQMGAFRRVNERLTNVGSGAALDVWVDAAAGGVRFRGVQHADELSPNSPMVVPLDVKLPPEQHALVVRWRAKPTGDERTWTHRIEPIDEP